MRAYDGAYAEAKGETEADALHNVACAIERMIAAALAVGPAGFVIKDLSVLPPRVWGGALTRSVHHRY